ncbi:hypothetical protein Back11_11930 [Paenibacillus baekrokdamisoli]|uniref:Uncharacterized protein n=1 Tax=Paenibacillus baekrokdamisoli TaxID=1712516 RepID=A0A3G9J7P9_9BACL|nr:hypothetical protein [Paenibacillus baekrokdamisoli]MBB3070498.1 hypothetical protein [Paenibacillus baekrokdamisoli]BBH19848.1 hypothetical protein Back11_11930 [Paenibacillus baekrokdamisoli]
MNTSWNNIDRIRLIGKHSQTLLFKLLKKGSENPEIIKAYSKPKPTNEQLPEAKMKKLTYVNSVIEEYRKDEELIVIKKREEKLKTIEDRLRQMGMIN